MILPISFPVVFLGGGDEKREEEPSRLLATPCELMSRQHYCAIELYMYNSCITADLKIAYRVSCAVLIIRVIIIMLYAVFERKWNYLL